MESVLARLRSSSSPLSLIDILNVPQDLAADVSIAPDGSFVETSSGPAARELKRHFDQLYGVGLSLRSPYAITAFVNQHGKQMFRVENRELSGPAAAAQDAETLLSEVHAHSSLNPPPASPPRSKRRSRLSMHNIFSPNVFSKSIPPSSPASPTSRPRPQTASSASSGRSKIRKTRSFEPGDQPAYQDQRYASQQGVAPHSSPLSGVTAFNARAHSQSVTSVGVSRLNSLTTLAVASSSSFAYPAASASSFSSSTPSASSGVNGHVPSPGTLGANILSQPVPLSTSLMQQGTLQPDMATTQPPPTNDIFAQVMKLGVPSSSQRHSYINPSTASFSSMATAGTASNSNASGGKSSSGYERSLASIGGSNQGQRERAFVQHPFGAGVIFDSPVRRSPRLKRNDSERSARRSSRELRPANADLDLKQQNVSGGPAVEGTSETTASSEMYYPSPLAMPDRKSVV